VSLVEKLKLALTLSKIILNKVEISMAWNEPGKDNDKGKDPWGGRGGNDGPPDLDEAFKKLQDKLNGMFGGGGSGGKNSSSNGSFGIIFAIIAVLMVLFYGFSGIYTVDAKERAVVLKLGVFQETMTEGLHWSAPLFTQVFKVNVTGERQYPSKGLMLTQDESIVDLRPTVQWNVADGKA